jgi:NAD(P)-dependent dehydrogenase (short-subunit alcohol dehydrogenase family)
MSYLESLFSLEGRTALVTGGSSGIGLMMAEALVMAGADVIITARKQAECAAAVARINGLGGAGKADAILADLAKEDQLLDLCRQIGGRWDALSILVNNAGRNWGAPFGKVPHKSWESVFALNVTAPFALCQELLPLLEKGGRPDDPARVINTGSSAGILPLGNNAFSYSASKPRSITSPAYWRASWRATTSRSTRSRPGRSTAG